MKLFSARIHVPFECDFEQATRDAAEKSSRFDPRSVGHFKFDKALLGVQFLKWINSHALRVLHTEVFYTPPFGMIRPHVDIGPQPEVIKLNWQFGAEDSRMFWYQQKTEVPLIATPTVINTSYARPDPKNLRFIESAKIWKPSLVTASVIHSVVNNTPEQRFVLCAVLNNVREDLVWSDALRLFQKDIV